MISLKVVKLHISAKSGKKRKGCHAAGLLATAASLRAFGTADRKAI